MTLFGLRKGGERKWGCNAVGTTLAWEAQYLHLKNGATEPPHGLYCKDPGFERTFSTVKDCSKLGGNKYI